MTRVRFVNSNFGVTNALMEYQKTLSFPFFNCFLSYCLNNIDFANSLAYLFFKKREKKTGG